MLSPAQIQEQEFTVRLLGKGYDPDEVDNFMDQLAEQLTVMNQTDQRLNAENIELRRQRELRDNAQTVVLADPPDVMPSPLASAQILLDVAQRTSDEMVAQAEAEAFQIKAKAEQDATGILSQAKADGDKLLAEVNAKVTEMQQRIEGMTSTRDLMRGQLARISTQIQKAIEE